MITKLQITGKLHYHRKCDFQLSKRKLGYRTLLPLTAPIGTSFEYTFDVQWDRHDVRRKTRVHAYYYRDVLLTQKLLPVIRRQISGNEFVFQQNSAPAHLRACETIELLRRETRQTLFHRNSGQRTVQILTRCITKSELQCSSAWKRSLGW